MMDKKTDHDHHVIRLAEHIEELLIELAMQREDANRPAQREVITLSGSGYPFFANGYRYNGMYVSGGQTVIVEYRGFQYSQVLQAGWNQLNLPDGCTVSTTGSSFMVELVRDNVQYSQMVNEVTGDVDVSGSQVTLTGNNAPLTVGAPRLLHEFPFSDFSASASTLLYLPGALTRGAKNRTFMVANSLNESLTSASVALTDSAVCGSGTSPIYSIINLVNLDAPGSYGMSIFTSEEGSIGTASATGLLSAHVDSVQIILGMGATLPTSGSVEVYVNES